MNNEQIIKEASEDVYHFVHCADCGGIFTLSTGEEIQLTVVDVENDGDGNENRMYVQVTDGGDSAYLLVTGTYSSWDRSMWDGVRQVLLARVTKKTFVEVDRTDYWQYETVELL